MNDNTTDQAPTPAAVALFTLSDIEAGVDAEPRIQDVLLADRLGYSRSRDIRQMIERNRDELQAYGNVAVRCRAVETGNGSIKEVKEFYLNESQGLLVCMFAKTPRAAAVRKALIEVFTSYRREHALGPMFDTSASATESLQMMDSLKLRKVNLCHRLFGERAGQQMWRKVDLEWVPAMASVFSQADMFDSATPPGSITITVAPPELRPTH